MEQAFLILWFELKKQFLPKSCKAKRLLSCGEDCAGIERKETERVGLYQGHQNQEECDE